MCSRRVFQPQIEKLDDVAESLEELWISYNQVTTLDGLSNLSNLARLYMSNNSVKNWAELDKLVSEGATRKIDSGCAVPKNESTREKKQSIAVNTIDTNYMKIDRHIRMQYMVLESTTIHRTKRRSGLSLRTQGQTRLTPRQKKIENVLYLHNSLPKAHHR